MRRIETTTGEIEVRILHTESRESIEYLLDELESYIGEVYGVPAEIDCSLEELEEELEEFLADERVAIEVK